MIERNKILATVLVSANVLTVLSSHGKSDLIRHGGSAQTAICRSYLNRIHETTLIRDGHIQSPPLNLIPGTYFSDYSLTSDALGDRVRVRIAPGDAGAPRLQAGAASSTGLQVVQTPQSASKPNLPKTDEEIRALVDTFLRVAREQNPPDAGVAEVLFKMGKKSPSQLEAYLFEIEAATRRKQQKLGESSVAIGQGGSGLPTRSSGESGEIVLSNVGAERYFWFTPVDGTRPVPARLLDLHRRSTTGEFSILVEYLDSGAEIVGRVRHVAEMTEKEFHSIRRDSALSSIESALELFGETLSPVEIQTQRLAQSLRIRLFGFASFDRHLERAGQATDSDRPLQMMNSLTALAMEGMIDERFGALRQIYSDPAFPNVVDSFSRISPKYVLEEFRAMDFQYTWVITEDGQLKVMPKGPVGNNLRPQLLRLSGGRRIFAGGDLQFQADGSLKVVLNSNYYQMADEAWGAGQAFRYDNPNLDEFVRAVFGTQSGFRVSGLSADDSRTFTRGAQQTGGETASSGGGRSRFEDFMDQMFAGGKSGSTTPTTVSWNEAGGKPSSFENWLQEVGRKEDGMNRNSLRLTWAHYVLKTDPTMPKKELKKQYRKLSLQFHPDRKETGDEEVQKLVSVAYDWIDKSMR